MGFNLYDLPSAFVILFLFLYGAVLGSFLTVCVHRLPRHVNVFKAWQGMWDRPSHCDRCERRIWARDNIPILGWVLLGGRCRFCRRGIPGRYPLIELANGLLFVLVYVMEVPLGRWTDPTTSCLSTVLSASNFHSAWGLSAAAMMHWRVAYHLVLVEALLVASLIDWDLMEIPDSVTLPAMFIGIVGAGAFGKFWLLPVWFQEPSYARLFAAWFSNVQDAIWWQTRVPEWIGKSPHLHGVAVSVAGLLVGGGMVWAVRLIGQFTLRREAMGFGDVVLMAMIGSFVGWQPIVVIFFVSPLFALLAVVVTFFVRWDREIPYGPYLSLGTIVVLLGWKWVFPLVRNWFELGPMLPPLMICMAATLLVLLWVIQLVKRLFGSGAADDDQPFDEWTSADQLFHFDGETVDRHQGQWRKESWPGDNAARGQQQLQQWLRPPRGR